MSAYFKSNEQSRNELENMKKVHEEYMKRLKDKYEKDKSEKDGSGDKKESKKAKGKSYLIKVLNLNTNLICKFKKKRTKKSRRKL